MLLMCCFKSVTALCAYPTGAMRGDDNDDNYNDQTLIMNKIFQDLK